MGIFARVLFEILSDHQNDDYSYLGGKAPTTDPIWYPLRRLAISPEVITRLKAAAFSDTRRATLNPSDLNYLMEQLRFNDTERVRLQAALIAQGVEIFLSDRMLPGEQETIDKITDIVFRRFLETEPIYEYYSCFISYSSKDQAFVERLHADLQHNGVRCWVASEDMKIGDEIRPRIEESIRLYDKLLLVLSTHSVASTWVAHEVKRALNKEPEGIPNVLFPIRLDDAVMKTKVGWAEDIRHTRHIGDFTHWKDHDTMPRVV